MEDVFNIRLPLPTIVKSCVKVQCHFCLGELLTTYSFSVKEVNNSSYISPLLPLAIALFRHPFTDLIKSLHQATLGRLNFMVSNYLPLKTLLLWDITICGLPCRLINCIGFCCMLVWLYLDSAQDGSYEKWHKWRG